MIRVWHQSLTDLTRLPRYAQHLREHAERVVGPGTTVEVHGVAPGTYPDGVAPIEVLRYPAAEYLLNTQILANACRAEQQGYDAVAVGCFFDPVLDELRSAVDIPVLSLCESSLLMATTAGSRYALLGISPANRHRLVELVDRYGASRRVCAVVEVTPTLTEDDLDAAFGEPSAIRPRLEDAARRAAEAGADLLIPAENVMNSLLTSTGIHQLGGLPVLDAYAALLTHAEAAIGLHQRSGLRVARGGRYARSPGDVLAAAAAGVGHALPAFEHSPTHPSGATGPGRSPERPDLADGVR